MQHIITVQKDRAPDPLTRERRWTARDYDDRIVTSGDSYSDAIARILRRLKDEVDPFATVFIHH